MAYKYLTSQRINSTIKKFGLKLDYTKGQKEFRFVDLSSGEQVGKTLVLDRLHSLTIGQWRGEAAAARGSVADGYAEAEAAAQAVRDVVETWDQAAESTEREKRERELTAAV